MTKSNQPLKGVIDIGTNSSRLLLFYVSDKNTIVRVKKFVRYTRMGQDLAKNKRLHPDAIQRNLEALKEYKNIAKDYGVSDIYAFGTSALRDAENSEAFLKKAKELGVKVDVVDGDTEAYYGFCGVTQTFDKSVLIFDIGGGSTEFILGKGSVKEKAISTDIGCVRMTEGYIFSDPPKTEEIIALKNACDPIIQHVKGTLGEPGDTQFVGIGGTATTLGAIHQNMREYNGDALHKSMMDLPAIKSIIHQLKAVPLKERQSITGLEPKRADIIIAGAIILERILENMGSDAFTICDWDNLEGAAYNIFINR